MIAVCRTENKIMTTDRDSSLVLYPDLPQPSGCIFSYSYTEGSGDEIRGS